MANMTSSRSAAQVAAELGSAPAEEVEELLERFADDPRQQVRKACERARRRLERERTERSRVEEMYARMAELGGSGVVVGVDEVGRGSVAGPLTVCAVCLPAAPLVWGLNDSKKLSPARRETLAARISDVARAVGIAHIPAPEIDQKGMAAALRVAVARAVADTGLDPDCVLMDGNPLHAHPREKNVVHGDALVACIAAASIVAKVTRDELMVALGEEYPAWPLAESKGYASPEHIAAIQAHGLSPVHRVSFCGNFLKQDALF